MSYFATGIICTLILAVTTTLIITLFVSKMLPKAQKKKKQQICNLGNQLSCNISTPDSTPQIVKQPIYDEIELVYKNSTLDLSRNITYGCTKM